MSPSLILFTIAFVFTVILGIYTYKRSKKKLWQAENIDRLTHLPNFEYFRYEAQRLLLANPEPYLMIVFDIKDFHLIADSMGRSKAVNLLIEVGHVVGTLVNPESDMLAHIHTDVFILLKKRTNDKQEKELEEHVMDLRHKFNDLLSEKFDRRIQLHVGLYPVPAEERNFDAIYEKSNYAHKIAKKTAPIAFYNATLQQQAKHAHSIEEEMEQALHNHEFHVFLQAKFAVNENKTVGAEALVRWKKPDDHLVFPNDFIPLFEKNTFILQLDMYMFTETCKLIRSWIDQGLQPVPISVNFSRLHLDDEYFIEKLVVITDKYEVPRKLLEIELTETIILENEAKLKGILNKLHDAGFILSIDDFGSGYSSLALLKNFPIDTIKLDKNFFRNINDNERARLLITKIEELAKALHIETIAEGIEDQEQINILNEAGCEYAQGYFYAKPMSAEDFALTLPKK